MDSTRLDVGDGARKYQGAPLGKVLSSYGVQAGATVAHIHGLDASNAAVTEQIPIADLMADDDIRLFSIAGDEEITFAVASMSGQVIARQVTRIDVE
jgi:DMSO/TMAO reductase YedYZ molybdopterin-dependent catalytic subunit